MKEGRVFVLFCHVEISHITKPLVVLLEWLENPPSVQVHQGGFLMFKPMV
jgi:hypothetical protein